MDLQDKNYYDILEKLLKITTKNLPLFTNYQDNDILVLLIKLLTTSTLVSKEYSDEYYDSNFVENNRYNIDRIWNLLDITSRINSLKLYITLECNKVFDEVVNIPVGNKFKYNNTDFVVFRQNNLNANNSFVSLELVEGKYVLRNLDYKLITSGIIQLNDLNISDSDVRFTVNGEEWEKVNNAQLYKGKYYSLDYTEENGYRLFLSSDWYDLIKESMTIKVEYVVSNLIKSVDFYASDLEIVTPIYDSQGNNVTSSFDKISSLDGMNIAGVSVPNKLLSKLLTVKDTCIARDEYQYLSEYHRGIAVAAAYDINSRRALHESLMITTPYVLKLVAAPIVGDYLTDADKEDLIKDLRNKGLLNGDLTVELKDPIYRLLNFNIRINANTDNETELSNIKSDIIQSINDALKVGNIPFGSTIYKNYINSLVLNSNDNINYIDISDLDDTVLGPLELPKIGTINVEFNLNIHQVSDSFYVDEDVFSAREEKVKDSLYLRDNTVVVIINSDDDEFKVNELIRQGYQIVEDVVVNENKTIIVSDYYDADIDYMTDGTSTRHLDYTSGEDFERDETDKLRDDADMLRDTMTWREDTHYNF